MPVVGIVLLIVALIIAFSFVGMTLSLLQYLVAGLIVGALARLVLPGRENISLLGTALVGVGGSMIGGVVGSALHVGGLISLALSVAASVGLLIAFGFRAKDQAGG